MVFFHFHYVTNQVSSQVSNLIFRAENLEKDIIDLDKTTKEKILEWGNVLEKLCINGYFDFSLDNISTYMRQKMRTAGKSEYFLDYITEVCPPAWKNSNLNTQEGRVYPPSSIYDQTDEQIKKGLSKEELEKMSNAELINYSKKFYDFHKSQHLRERDAKNQLNEVLDKRQIKIQNTMYTKEKPPEQYQGPSKLYYSIQHYIEAERAFLDRLERINENDIFSYPPSGELDEKCSRLVDTFTAWEVKAKEKLLIPFDDDKHSDDKWTWYEVMVTEFYHGKHAAAVLHAQNTGEYEMRMVNGKMIRFPKTRPYTREQVGDKIPELVDSIIDDAKLNGIQHALHEWFTKTVIKVPKNNIEDLK